MNIGSDLRSSPTHTTSWVCLQPNPDYDLQRDIGSGYLLLVSVSVR